MGRAYRVTVPFKRIVMDVQTPPRPVAGDINVTPMIDVLLVLIISFFILNLPMKYIPVTLPPPQGGTGGPAQLVLELPDAGGYTLNRQPIPDAEFDQAIHSAFDTRPVKLLFVGAGPSRRYAEVVAAMERARLDGVQVVAFLPAATPGP